MKRVFNLLGGGEEQKRWVLHGPKTYSEHEELYTTASEILGRWSQGDHEHNLCEKLLF